MLWVFAEALGYALERCVLAERLRAQAERVIALVRSTEASVTELGRPASSCPRPRRFARRRSDAAGARAWPC